MRFVSLLPLIAIGKIACRALYVPAYNSAVRLDRPANRKQNVLMPTVPYAMDFFSCVHSQQ